MKIGILTFHRAINNGAVLQCYALYTTLKNLGHDVEVIDYRPESIEKYRMYFRKKDFKRAKGLSKIRYLLSCLSSFLSKKITSTKFDKFIKNNLKTTSKILEIQQIPQYYDAVVFGSDKIWSYEHCEGLDKVYYGQFPKCRAKFIAYAASIGRIDFITRGERINTFRRYLDAFDKIGVREVQTQSFLNREIKKDSQIVCDPCFLLPNAQWSSLAKRNVDTNYVLLLNFVCGDDALDFSTHIAKQLGTKVIQIKAVVNPFNWKSNYRAHLSPNDFLGYIQNARCIITDSFHATAFSVILHKDFYTLIRHNNNDRTATMLGVVGLSDRMVDKKSRVTFKTVDFTSVDDKISEYRNKSLEFLTESLFI